VSTELITQMNYIDKMETYGGDDQQANEIGELAFLSHLFYMTSMYRYKNVDAEKLKMFGKHPALTNLSFIPL
jgi:hypothetical protein